MRGFHSIAVPPCIRCLVFICPGQLTFILQKILPFSPGTLDIIAHWFHRQGVFFDMSCPKIHTKRRFGSVWKQFLIILYAVLSDSWNRWSDFYFGLRWRRIHTVTVFKLEINQRKITYRGRLQDLPLNHSPFKSLLQSSRLNAKFKQNLLNIALLFCLQW